MDLKTYLAEAGETQTALAEKAGTTVATISRLAAGKLKPSLDLAHAIERETGGKVPTEIWVSVETEAEPESPTPSEQEAA